MRELPKKMSDLLEHALDDLKAVEQDEKYVVNMNNWHAYTKSKKCIVCLAGSVLAKSLDRPHDETYTLLDDHKERTKLSVINFLRMGDVDSAALKLGAMTRVKNRTITDYSDNREKFVSDILDLIKDLREDGC